MILLGKGNLAEAELHARNAVRIAPENPQAHNLMGMILTEAQPAAGRRIPLSPRAGTGRPAAIPILLANLAWNLKNQGRMEEARALYRGIRRRRAGDPADPAGLGAAGGSRPRLRRRRRAARPDGQAVPRTIRACCCPAPCCWAGCSKYDEALVDARSTRRRSQRRRAGPQRTAGERPPARPDGPLRRRLGRLRRRQAAGARAHRPGLSGRRGRQPAVEPPARLLHRRPAATAAARQRARRRAAADVHPRLPALRHHAGGADAVGASADRRRRRTAADQRHHRADAAHAEQPARLSGGAGRTLDGRPARGPGQFARLLPAEGRASWASLHAGRRAGSPTRCR